MGGSRPYRDWAEEVLSAGRGVREDWRSASAAEMTRWLRERFEMTQRQLALLSGLPQSKIHKIERGQEVELRTLRRVFAGFGCGLAILPVCRLSAEELWRRVHDLHDDGCIPRRRRYPR